MAYLGKTPSQATRARYYYTATGGETSLSGSDDNGNTLVFSDGNYVDVMLNGVTLVAGTDYNTTTANTIGGLTALTASDVVEVVVYDTFSVFGGNVNGNFNIQNGTLTASQGITVDNDGATVATFDRATSDGTIVDLQKDGSSVGSIGSANSGVNLYIAGTNASVKIANDPAVIPATTSGANNDATVDLGSSGSRWKDLYLSGGVYLGGTGAANYLDDYEEGTWTPVYSTSSGYSGITGITVAVANYVKIGNIVHITAQFTPAGTGTTTVSVGDQILLTGLPFSPKDITVGANIHPQGRVMVYESLGSNIWADGMTLVDNNTAGLHLEIVSVSGAASENAKHLLYATYQV